MAAGRTFRTAPTRGIEAAASTFIMSLRFFPWMGVFTAALGAAACSERADVVGTTVSAATEAVPPENLKSALDAEARGFGFNVSYAVHDLQDDAHWELHGDRPQKAASSIKLFTLTGAIAQIARGDGPTSTFGDVEDAFLRTLEHSDDSATDATLLALGGGDRSAGIAYTNQHLARLGVDPSKLRFVSWINDAREPTYVAPAPGNLAERYNRMATNEVTKVLAALYRGADFANDPIPGSGGAGAIDFLLDTIAEHGISYADAGWPDLPARYSVSEKIGVIGPGEANLQATNSIGIVRLYGCSRATGTVAYSYATMVQAELDRTFVHAEAKQLLGRVARATIGFMSAKYGCGLRAAVRRARGRERRWRCPSRRRVHERDARVRGTRGHVRPARRLRELVSLRRRERGRLGGRGRPGRRGVHLVSPIRRGLPLRRCPDLRSRT